MKPKTRIFAPLICVMCAIAFYGFSEELQVKDIVITDARDSVPPSESLLREILHAGHTTDSPRGVDLSDHGALSNNIVIGRISSITVTYALVSFERVENAFRRILSAPAPPNPAVAHLDEYCHTYTAFVWAQGSGGAVAAATVKHTEGQNGYFLLWDHGRFGYRDPMGKWWLGSCRAAFQDSTNSPELGNNPREDGNEQSD